MKIGMSTFWPEVCVALRFACFVLAFCGLQPVFHAAEAQSGNLSEQYLFAAANRDRLERGLTPLRYDQALASAALAHAQQMAARQAISHQFTGEPGLALRVARAGVRFSLVTENVAEAGNSALIHELWMHSEGHRANLLDPKVDSVGIAVVARSGQLYAVQDFARSVESLSLLQQEAIVGELVASGGVAILPDSHDAERTCALSTGFVGARRPWFVMRFTAADLKRLPDELVAKLATSRYHEAAVGACSAQEQSPFTSYQVAVLLYP